eukprot:TRINITY_DN4558_c0_g1_i1.p1 TRINITY_DN4558_c0_g1~~TRINITY_DN4558_c0_g1_i1.p1  ORF type:complete len:147 (-),score=34.10 TRINITY_DN4558_c0_g1_i1:12-407(-)
MEPLRIWLLVVAGLSVFGAGLGVLWPESIRFAQFNVQQDQVTPLAARFFTAWTLLASIVRTTGAFNLNDRGAYLSTLGTFFVAWYVYGTEIFYYNTITLRTAWAPAFISTTSIIWMIKEYPQRFGKQTKRR